MTRQFAQAEDLLRQADEVAQRYDEPDAWNVRMRALWQLRSAQGRRSEMEGQVRTVHVPQIRFWYDALLGLVLLERDDPAQRIEALRAIGSAVQTRPEEFAFSYALMTMWAELGEAAVAANLTEVCQRLLQLDAALTPEPPRSPRRPSVSTAPSITTSGYWPPRWAAATTRCSTSNAAAVHEVVRVAVAGPDAAGVGRRTQSPGARPPTRSGQPCCSTPPGRPRPNSTCPGSAPPSRPDHLAPPTSFVPRR